MSPFIEKTLQCETIYQGKLVHLEKLTVELPNGKQSTREIIRHPGAVALLALLSERVLLVRQFRKAIEKSCWEIPAGTLEPGESPATCAQRELMEETGYRAKRLTQLSFFYTAAGFCDEAMTLFKAEGLSPMSDVHGDDDEFITVGDFSLQQTNQLIASGDICDAKTLLALALWRNDSQQL